jgi:hypothetical protein
VIVIPVVVVIVPVLLVVPAMLVFIPPLVMFVPATLASFVQLLPAALCVFTLRSILLNRDVQQLIGPSHASLAIRFTLGARPRHCREKQHSRQESNCDRRLHY